MAPPERPSSSLGQDGPSQSRSHGLCHRAVDFASVLLARSHLPDGAAPLSDRVRGARPDRQSRYLRIGGRDSCLPFLSTQYSHSTVAAGRNSAYLSRVREHPRMPGHMSPRFAIAMFGCPSGALSNDDTSRTEQQAYRDEVIFAIKLRTPVKIC